MKIFLALLLAITLGSPALYAEENNKSNDSSGFWDTLRKKVELLVPEKKLSATTATAGVRGAHTSTDDIYWKGDAATHTVGVDELAAFQKAMDFAGSGDLKQARAAFTEFINNYPDSQLRKDASQALVTLQPKQ